MFIQTESTPNPNVIKFIPGRDVLEQNQNTLEFLDKDTAKDNKLASMIFENDGVVGVMLGYDFISVTKEDSADWYNLRPIVLGTIMEYFSSVDVAGASNISNSNNKEGQYGTKDSSNDEHPTIDPEKLSGVEKEIFELIETRVRPAVAMDGGDIVFKEFKDGIVFLQMKGACSGCPSSTATLKIGIENMLKHYIPEVLEVRAA